MSSDRPGSEVERWRNALGDWSEDDPNVLAWPWKHNEPVVADVDGTLKLLHGGLLYPREIDGELEDVLDDLGEPSIRPLSKEYGRVSREIFEWEYDG